jgi:hypothetical protein
MRILRIIIIVAIAMQCGVSLSQTIHKDDIEYFFGKFSLADSLERSFDLSAFADWKVNPRDSLADRSPQPSFGPERGLVVNLPTVEQSSKIVDDCRHMAAARKYNELRFFVMSDRSRWGTGNVLTVWEVVGPDSLRYLCARSCRGYYEVDKVSFFNDGTLLVVLCGGSGDVDFVTGAYSFLYGTPCHLEELYSNGWKKEEWVKSGTYVFYNIPCPTRQVTEVTEYSSLMGDAPDYWHRIDSASAKVLDMWKMVQDRRKNDSLTPDNPRLK